MSQKTKRQYVGNAWEQKNSTNSSLFYNLSIEKEHLLDIPSNEKGFVSLAVARKKEADPKFNTTHSVYVPLKEQKDDLVDFIISFKKEEALEFENDHGQIQLTVSPIDKEYLMKEGKEAFSDYVVKSNPYKISDEKPVILGNGWDKNIEKTIGSCWEREGQKPSENFFNVAVTASQFVDLVPNERGYVNLSLVPNPPSEDQKQPSHRVVVSKINQTTTVLNFAVNKSEALANLSEDKNIYLSISPVSQEKKEENNLNYDYYVKTTAYKNTNKSFSKEKSVVGNGWKENSTAKNKEASKQKTATNKPAKENDGKLNPDDYNPKKNKKGKKGANISGDVPF